MAEEQNEKVIENIDVETVIAQPRLLSFLFAEWVSVTKDDKPIVAGIFDRLNIPLENLPVEIRFSLYLRLAQVYDMPVAVLVFLPDGKHYAQFEMASTGDMNRSDNGINIYQIVGAINLVLPQHGVYWFEVHCGEHNLGLVPLTVQPVPMEGLDASAINGIPARIPGGVPPDSTQ